MALEGLKQFIPGTKARQKRMFATGFRKLAAGHAGVVEIEWPDDTKTYVPVDWDTEEDKLVGPEGFEVKPKGLGSRPKTIFGVNVWNVDAKNYGIISTEACLIADREHRGHVHEGMDALLYMFNKFIDAVREAEEIQRVQEAAAEDELADGQATATDGGVAVEPRTPRPGAIQEFMDLAESLPEELVMYDLDPLDGGDFQTFSVQAASDFDPWPVRGQDARQAVNWARASGLQDSDFLMGLLVGVGIPVGLWLIVTVVSFILNALSGNAGDAPANVISLAPALIGKLPSALMSVLGVLPF